MCHGAHGTAYYYVGQNLKYPIAGKSGTAQVAGLPQDQAAPDEMTVRTAATGRTRSFIAFSPIEHPKIAIAVVVEHGGGGQQRRRPDRAQGNR